MDNALRFLRYTLNLKCMTTHSHSVQHFEWSLETLKRAASWADGDPIERELGLPTARESHDREKLQKCKGRQS